MAQRESGLNVQFGWDPRAAQRDEQARLDREIARHVSLSRLGCLGGLGAGLLLAVGALTLWYGFYSGDGITKLIGVILLAIAIVLGIASSAFNMTHFGLSYAKRLKRR